MWGGEDAKGTAPQTAAQMLNKELKHCNTAKWAQNFFYLYSLLFLHYSKILPILTD